MDRHVYEIPIVFLDSILKSLRFLRRFFQAGLFNFTNIHHLLPHRRMELGYCLIALLREWLKGFPRHFDKWLDEKYLTCPRLRARCQTVSTVALIAMCTDMHTPYITFFCLHYEYREPTALSFATTHIFFNKPSLWLTIKIYFPREW